MTANTTRAAPSVTGAHKRARPVVWWATFGALLLTFQTAVWIRWLFAAKPTPSGATPQPHWMTVVQTATQIVMPLLLVYTCYVYVIRPKIRTGRLSRDGLLWISWLLLWFWDPMLNFFQNLAVYNPNLVNFGSWTTGIFPGWSAPRSNYFAEPVLMMPAVYAAVLFPSILWTCPLMQKLRNRGLTAPMNIAVTWLIMSVVSLVLEGLVFMPLGFYVMPGAQSDLSINAGKYYQFPIYHALLFGAWCAGAAALRFFTGPDGQTAVERGAASIGRNEGQRTFVRFLALFAATVSLNALYFVPIQFFALRSGAWPASIVQKSYFRGGLCGEGTTYACPGPEIPIPRPGSVHVDPDGKLVPP